MPAVIALGVLACFLPALDAGFVNWDDLGLLLENPAYRGLGPRNVAWMFTTFHMGHYHPLTWLTFALDHAMWGMEPRGYHLTNVVLHAANAVLVYVLARQVLAAGGVPRDRRTLPAVLGALLFGVHPLRVESVAWVTERRDVLSTFFLLLAAVAWLRYQAGARAGYGLALGAFACSLLAKAWGMTFPAVLLVLDVWPFRRRGLRQLIVEKLPFVGLAVVAAVLALLAQLSVGATADATHLGPLQRTMQALYGLAFYVRKSVLPTNLSPIYLLDRDLNPTAPAYLLSAAAVLAGAALLIVARRPALGAAFAIYAIVVSPVLGFAQSGVQIAADRYSYVACIPLALLAGAGLAALGRPGPVLALAVLAALGVATWRQAALWHDSITLWSHALAVDPANWLAHNSRGDAYLDAGDLDRARADFDAAIRLRSGYASAYSNRGHLQAKRGDLPAAIEDWNHALTLDPALTEALLNRGAARLMQNDVAGALSDLETAVRVSPTSASAWYNLATAHVMAGQMDRAIEDCRQALATAPQESDVHARAMRKLEALLAQH